MTYIRRNLFLNYDFGFRNSNSFDHKEFCIRFCLLLERFFPNTHIILSSTKIYFSLSFPHIYVCFKITKKQHRQEHPNAFRLESWFLTLGMQWRCHVLFPLLLFVWVARNVSQTVKLQFVFLDEKCVSQTLYFGKAWNVKLRQVPSIMRRLKSFKFHDVLAFGEFTRRRGIKASKYKYWNGVSFKTYQGNSRFLDNSYS